MSQVKFKIGFTIPSDTLIAMIAKFLPIEDLSVEEIVPKPTLAERSIAIHKLTQQAIATHKPKPQLHKRASPGPNLKKGINGLIMAELSTGPKRAAELQPKVKAAGFSENSVTSRLEELRKYGVIERDDNRLWKRCAT
jgi:hypothetical protein